MNPALMRHICIIKVVKPIDHKATGKRDLVHG